VSSFLTAHQHDGSHSETFNDSHIHTNSSVTTESNEAVQ